MILADGEQWKSDIEYLRIPQSARKVSRIRYFLPSCFRRQCQCITIWMIYLSVVLICDVTFLHIRNMYATRFSSDAKSFTCVDSNDPILNPFVSCGELHADIVTNLEHNQHEPVTLNLESSGTCRSPLTRGGCNRTLLTSLEIYICSVCNLDCQRQRPYIQAHQFDFIFHTVYAIINARITQNRTIFGGKDPVL